MPGNCCNCFEPKTPVSIRRALVRATAVFLAVYLVPPVFAIGIAVVMFAEWELVLAPSTGQVACT